MNKVITINLNGNAYQLEEAGYELLRAYLDGAFRRLEGNPDRDEIISDIEQAIADKCRALLNAFKTVVVTRELQQIIDEMGPVENATAPTDGPAAAGAASATSADDDRRPRTDGPDFKTGGPVRRLFLIPEGAMLGGVCNGIAAYLNVDVTLVRIAFVLLTLLWGMGILVYLLLNLLLPTADTAAEKAAAHGTPSTTAEFIRRAREGYYEGMRSFSDKHAHREWRRRFRAEMRGWRRTFKHEMRANRFRWWHHWTPSGAGAPPPPPSPGAWLAVPFVSLLRGALVLVTLFAVVSVLATGAVYSLPLPEGIPAWGGVILILVAYKLVAWPLKSVRRAYYYSAGWGTPYSQPAVWAFEALIGIGFALALFWLAKAHWPEIREALHALPGAVHQGIDAVRDWWRRH